MAIFPPQRWRIATPDPNLVTELTTTTAYSPAMAQVLVNRQITSPQEMRQFLEGTDLVIPDPVMEFADLSACVDLLEQMIRSRQKISICGDYDVDGMTSTALLIRTIRALGGTVDYAIPSRMTEGYGINNRIVQELHAQGTRLIITVDNGIMAKEPIELARQLGVGVIITDHHELPELETDLPPANGILNPKYKLSPTSLYGSIAGVGMAYVLALVLIDRFGQRAQLEEVLLELFTLGTIADLAALTGINRHLVKRGLQCLGNSKILGIRALISTISGDDKKEIAPDVIGFQLGPRINAIGRMGDPQVVIDLLTTDDPAIAQERAQTCHEVNKLRQDTCASIEQEAIEFVERMLAEGKLNLGQSKALVLVDVEVQEFLEIPNAQGWHHGVIGIVASRLVERYGAPVFIGSREHLGAEPLIRFSVRGIPEFHVFQSLEFIKDLRIGGGGHKAAGGFTMPQKHLQELRSRLALFANQSGIRADQIVPFIEVDAKLALDDISPALWKQLEKLQPCGIGNSVPIFYSENVRIISQTRRGKDQQCLALELAAEKGPKIKAIAWKWGEYCPIPNFADVAYRLKENNWQGHTSIELEIVGLRYPTWQPVLECKAPPNLSKLPKFANLYGVPRPLPRPLLLYGYDRPEQKFTGDVDYDRPQRHYHTLVLWSLPPSVIHLQWLINATKPHQVLIGDNAPPLPSIETVLQRVHQLLGKSVLNLLEISQQWWVSPAVIIAALREIGYACPTYSPTQSLSQELANLQEWYQSSIDVITQGITLDPTLTDSF